MAATDTLEENGGRSVAPDVYIDCSRCDYAYIREEIRYVNYVRDQEQAQVHVFITHQGTGSGGRIYTLSFIGREPYEGLDNTLEFTSQQGESWDEERGGLTRVIGIGLVPYVARTSLVSRLHVSFTEPESMDVEEIEDPWDNWVFQLSGSGNYNTEESQKRIQMRYAVEARRITEAWKFVFRPYFNYDERNFKNDDEADIRSVSHRNGMVASAVMSLTDHWSAGVYSDVLSTTYDNIDFRFYFRPAVEYSLFPYQEASRREITITYRIGGGYFNYIEETIFDKREEYLFSHSLEASVRIRQPWGSLSAGLEGSHYLHDISKNRTQFYGQISFRLVKGLSVNISSDFEIIHDQLYLKKGDASQEELLLQLRQLATTFELSGSIGLAYTFGSIYNNVVNTRL